MGHVSVDFKTIESYGSFQVDNVLITPIAVNHVENTDGFLLEDVNTGKKVAYLSDLHGIPEKTRQLIDGIDTIITDATYLESDLTDDPTHFHNEQLVPFLDSLNTKETILTNIGSYQGVTHADFEKKYPKYTIAYDGMSREYLS